MPAGSRITVRNGDAAVHTVTANSGAFDVTVPEHGTATFTAPDKAGNYPFHCRPHPFMTAVLIVTVG